MFSYGSAVRKVMYTTNAIESVNSSFRKVTKKGSFPNEDAVFKLLYLRVQELYQKWAGRRIPNWALVRNQLLMDERMAKLMEDYDTTYWKMIYTKLLTPPFVLDCFMLYCS